MDIGRYYLDGFEIIKTKNEDFEQKISLHLDKKYFKKAASIMKENHIVYIEINIDTLDNLDFLKDFSFLKGITFISVGSICDFKGLRHLSNIEEFSDFTNKGLKKLQWNFNYFENLKICRIIFSREVVLNLQIQELQLFNYNEKDLDSIKDLFLLKKLTLTNCKLSTFNGIENFINLEVLELWNLGKLQDLTPIHKIANSLRAISIVKCKNINDYSSLYNCINIESFHISESGKLKTLSFLKDFSKLKTANISVDVDDEDSAPLQGIKNVYIYKGSNLKLS